MMVAILVIGLLGFAFIFWRNREQQITANTLTGVPVYTPKAPPLAESVIISSIPLVGPLASYTVTKAGNAIIQNQFLEQHSQVGPNPGQTEASAGIAGITVGKGWTYTQVGHGLKKALEFWDW